MSADSRLDILPQFEIRDVSVGTETALVTGTFSQVERVAIDERGWLFVPDESSIADGGAMLPIGRSFLLCPPSVL